MTERKRPKRRRNRKPVERGPDRASATDLARAERVQASPILKSVDAVFNADGNNADYFFQSIANLLSMSLGYPVDEFAINVRSKPDPTSGIVHIKWVREKN